MTKNARTWIGFGFVAVVVLWLYEKSKGAGAGAGATSVSVASGVAELAPSASGYAFHLPAGGAWTSAYIATPTLIAPQRLAVPAAGGALAVAYTSGAAITLAWTQGGVAYRTVYTVQ